MFAGTLLLEENPLVLWRLLAIRKMFISRGRGFTVAAVSEKHATYGTEILLL